MKIAARIASARAETAGKLEKALAYSHEFRKPEQIRFYTAHIEHLDKLARGEESEGARSNLELWDVMQCQIDASTCQ